LHWCCSFKLGTISADKKEGGKCTVPADVETAAQEIPESGNYGVPNSFYDLYFIIILG